MVYICFDDYTDYAKLIRIYSDKSQKEAKHFVEMARGHYYRYNKKPIGLYYAKEISDRQLSNILSNAEGNEDGLDWYFGASGIPYKIIDPVEWKRQREAQEKLIPKSNVDEVTDAVKRFLEETYDIGHIKKEYTHSLLDVRADLFSVTKDRRVVTAEVKSDKDTIARLEKQLRGYSRFSHIVYVATDERHLASVERLLQKGGVLSCVGLLVYGKDGLYEEIKPYHRQSIDATRIIWKDELKSMLGLFDIKGFGRMSATRLEQIAHDIFTVSEYRALCEYLFVSRYLKDADEHKIKSLISDPLYKQQRIYKLLDK